MHEIFRKSDSQALQVFEEGTCNIDSLVIIVCKKFGVTFEELKGSEKRRELVQARGVFARAAQMKKGLDLRMVCPIFLSLTTE